LMSSGVSTKEYIAAVRWAWRGVTRFDVPLAFQFFVGAESPYTYPVYYIFQFFSWRTQ
jgi:hypothetical protein